MSLLLANRALIKPSGIAPTEGLIAKWLGGSILDTSGSPIIYDGTLFGDTDPTLVNGINGEANGAYSFDSAESQYIDFGVISELMGIEKLSFSTWMKKATGDKLMIGSDSIDSVSGNEILWFSNNLTYGLVRDGVANTVSSTASVLNDFNHIVMVYDGSEAVNADRVKLWINNVEVTKIVGNVIPVLTSTAEPTSTFQMGRWVEASPVFADGAIASTYIYDRVISTGEIATLFAEKTI